MEVGNNISTHCKTLETQYHCEVGGRMNKVEEHHFKFRCLVRFLFWKDDYIMTFYISSPSKVVQALVNLETGFGAQRALRVWL